MANDRIQRRSRLLEAPRIGRVDDKQNTVGLGEVPEDEGEDEERVITYISNPTRGRST